MFPVPFFLFVFYYISLSLAFLPSSCFFLYSAPHSLCFRLSLSSLVFKLSPCSKCNLFLFGYFPGVWVLIADVSELRRRGITQKGTNYTLSSPLLTFLLFLSLFCLSFIISSSVSFLSFAYLPFVSFFILSFIRYVFVCLFPLLCLPSFCFFLSLFCLLCIMSSSVSFLSFAYHPFVFFL